MHTKMSNTVRATNKFEVRTQPLVVSPNSPKPWMPLLEVPSEINTNSEHGTPKKQRPPGFTRKQCLRAYNSPGLGHAADYNHAGTHPHSIDILYQQCASYMVL